MKRKRKTVEPILGSGMIMMTGDNKFIFEDGEIKKVSLERWAQWFNADDRFIKHDKFDNILVSTVFIGDGSTFFESMILGGPFDQEQMRTETLDEALKAHTRLLKMSGILELTKLRKHQADEFISTLESL